MKLLAINGTVYVKKWFRLYYVVYTEGGVPVLVQVKKLRVK